jgi:signal transduction histidine kinase
MLPDLPTLLLVRLGVDVLIAGAFWSLMRRYPAIGGPGWWSLGSVISIVGTLALMSRSGGAGPLMAAASAVLLFGAHATTWLGLRSYLRLPMPWRVLGTVSGVHAVLQVGLAFHGDRSGPHQLAYAVAGLVLVVLVLRDLVGLKAHNSTREFHELTLVTLAEGVALLLVLGWMVSRQQAVDQVSAGFMLAFLLTKFLRTLIFSALVSLRLRQDVEQARKAMAEREADSRALITNLGAGVVVFRPDRSIVSANNAARRFFDWPIDERELTDIPPLPEWRLVREDGKRMPRHEVPFERVLATGQPVIGLMGGFQTVPGNAVRWALCNAYPENDAIGGLRHVVFTFVDITSLKQAQQQQRVLETQLAQSQKMEALGTLAGGVAHDFNNILAAILGNADLARQDLPPASPVRESLHEISSAARRGRELVRQILAFSRQQPLAPTPVRPGAIVAETCSLMRSAIPPHVQLVQQVAPRHQAILADPTQLGQVLLNLGTNAVHALLGRPGRIEFQVADVAPWDPVLPASVAQACRDTGRGAVRISVMDDGCGMDDTTRARMFEPFFTTKVVGHGTGLGLPVVLGIVEAHGGAIVVDSSPGAGTTFTLYFPATAAPPQRASSPDAGVSPSEGGTMSAVTSGVAQSPPPHPVEHPVMADDPSSTPRHILYLDDDDTLVFLVRRLLERRGYKVTALTDQQEAIDAVRAQPEGFHLLMTDYNMPGMSGIDVAREVLLINPRLPVAVASGYISDELQSEAQAAGVTEVVFKTDAVEAFCEIVARLVTPPRPA